MVGPFASRSRIFYILLGAGISFIVIGSASALYTLTPVPVSLNGTVEAGQSDLLTPSMNVGNPVAFSVTGSNSSIEIVDPENDVIRSVTNVSDFRYNFTAQKDGQYLISIENLGSSDLFIGGSAFTKGSQIAFAGQLMLIVTGIIVPGTWFAGKASMKIPYIVSQCFLFLYEPRIFTNAVFGSMTVKTSLILASRTCPSKSVKKLYSHGVFLVGRDSILVRLISLLANSDKIFTNDPGACLTEKIMDVPSFPDGFVCIGSLDNIKNLVKLFFLSSIPISKISIP